LQGKFMFKIQNKICAKPIIWILYEASKSNIVFERNYRKKSKAFTVSKASTYSCCMLKENEDEDKEVHYL
jgi:hypothetical protein